MSSPADGDGGDSGRQYPRNLQGILNFCTEHTKSEDAPSDALSFTQMDPETDSTKEAQSEMNGSGAASEHDEKIRRPSFPTTNMEKARKAQDQALKSLGLYRYRIPGDGNCMFRALGTQLGLDAERYHPVLREAASKWMTDHLEELMGAGLLDSPEEVVQWGRMGVWPGQAALVGLANIFGIDIAVLHGGDHGDIDIQHITPFEGGEASGMQGSVILAYLYNGHYDAVVDEPDLANPQYASWLARCQEEMNASEALARELARQDEHLPTTGQTQAPLSTLPPLAMPEREFATDPKSPERTGPEPEVYSGFSAPPTTSTERLVPRMVLPERRLTTTAPTTQHVTGTTETVGTHTGPAHTAAKTIIEIGSSEDQTGTGPLITPPRNAEMEPSSPRIRIVPIHFVGKKRTTTSQDMSSSVRSPLTKELQHPDISVGIRPRFIQGLQSASGPHVTSVPIDKSERNITPPQLSRQSSAGSSSTMAQVDPQSPTIFKETRDRSHTPLRVSHERSQTPLKVDHESSPSSVTSGSWRGPSQSPMRTIPIRVSHSSSSSPPAPPKSVSAAGGPKVRDIPIVHTDSTGLESSANIRHSLSTDNAGSYSSKNTSTQQDRNLYSQPHKITDDVGDSVYTSYRTGSSLSRDASLRARQEASDPGSSPSRYSGIGDSSTDRDYSIRVSQINTKPRDTSTFFNRADSLGKDYSVGTRSPTSYSRGSSMGSDYTSGLYTGSNLLSDPMLRHSQIDSETRDILSKYPGFGTSSAGKDYSFGTNHLASEPNKTRSRYSRTSNLDEDYAMGKDHFSRETSSPSYGSSYTPAGVVPPYKPNPISIGLRGFSYDGGSPAGASRQSWSRSGDRSCDSSDGSLRDRRSASPKIRDIPIQVEHGSKPYWTETQRLADHTSNTGKDDEFGLPVNIEEVDLSKPFDLPSFLRPLRKRFNWGDDVEDFLKKNANW